MHIDRRILRLGTAVILAAVLLRLLGNGLPPFLPAAETASALLFLQTGRVVKVTRPAAEPTAPTAAAAEESPTPVRFSPEDAALVEIQDHAGKGPDITALLLRDLDWDLTGQAPKVLICHTHTTESYENTQGYPQTSPYHTLEEDHNMVAVGDRVAERLKEKDLPVLQDRQIHDHPSYNSAYSNSRETVSQLLEDNPTLELILDLHRDAATDGEGNQVRYTVQTPEGTAAKLMLVVGTNHTDWEENLALAVKLQVILEKLCPGICRPLTLRGAKYNQQLSPGAVLVEVGSAGNTQEEALLAADILAQAVAAIKAGSTS